MTAGHNAFRGSGPGQKPAFEMHWHKWVLDRRHQAHRMTESLQLA
jgi:hypothetical protein